MADYDSDSWSMVPSEASDDECLFSDDEGFTKVKSERQKTVSKKPVAVSKQDTPDTKRGRQVKRLKTSTGRMPSLQRWETEEPMVPSTVEWDKKATPLLKTEWDPEPTPPQNIPKRAKLTFQAQPNEKTWDFSNRAFVESLVHTKRPKSKQSKVQFVPAEVKGGRDQNSKKAKDDRSQIPSSRPAPAAGVHHSVPVDSQKMAGTTATNVPALARSVSTIARGLDKFRFGEKNAAEASETAQTTAPGTKGIHSSNSSSTPPSKETSSGQQQAPEMEQTAWAQMVRKKNSPPSNPTNSRILDLPTGSPWRPIEASSDRNCPSAHSYYTSANYPRSDFS
ncbi:hypothetical protein IFR05_010296 [Cadophora sp. M221]|nr:hypothetical protein IFR05_010296 [Cadophora sp. M221]